ncbi:4-diphosphocytidyl-2-C-methyl-D-erythritol kinase [Candidatus Zixiibacteriota bacterium]|nr:4-diphosphocytidyl-2-C-methyl-D-erythritol kinase [candidate division Zixibacteria bacterium]
MDWCEIKAPAKINLFLKILGKRADNYHDLFSWFQAVSLFDYLTFSKSPARFDLTIDSAVKLPADENNLIIRTARRLFAEFKLPGGLTIWLKKNIPVAAGLAGGSSDAAATIYAINKLFSLSLTVPEMRHLALEIGSDIPFFFSSGQAEITGRGEVIKEITLPTDYYILLITPPLHISTADSYRLLNLGLTTGKGVVNLSHCDNFEELIGRICDIGNDFETIHLDAYPVLGRIKDALDRAGARIARMSGSGPTVFGLFDKMPEREDLFQITRGDWQVVEVRPITLPAWD